MNKENSRKSTLKKIGGWSLYLMSVTTIGLFFLLSVCLVDILGLLSVDGLLE